MPTTHLSIARHVLLLCSAGICIPAWGQAAPQTGESSEAPRAPDTLAAAPAPETDDANTIVVTASRGHHAPDRQSYDVRSPDTGTLEVVDAVARLPGAIVDIDGSLSILGEKTIFYRINDEGVSADLVLHLPASMIGRIEVISNPGAADSRRAGIIINIVLSEENTRAARIITARAQADSRERFEGSLNYRLEGEPWSIIASANGEWQSTRTRNDQRDTFPSGANASDFISDTGASYSRNGTYSANLLVGRDVGDDKRLSTLCNINGGNIRRDGVETHLVSLSPGLLTRQDVITNDQFDYLGWGCNLSFSFARRGESNSALSLSYNRFDRDQDLTQSLTGDLGDSRFTFGDNGRSNDFGAEFKRTVEYGRRERLELGVEWAQSDAMRRYRFATTPLAVTAPGNTLFTSENREISGYATYQFPLGAIDIKAGARLSSRRADLAVDGVDLLFGPRRTRLLPSLHVEYPLSNGLKLRASAGDHYSQYSEDYFNPALIQSGYNAFQRGDGANGINVNRVYELSLEYTRGRLAIISRLYARTNDNSVFPITEFAGNDRYVRRYITASADTRYGFNLNLKQPVTSAVLLTGDVDLFRQSYRWQDQGPRELERTSWTAKLNVDWQVDSNDAVLLIGQYVGRSISFDRTRSGVLSSSLKYTHDFPHNLSLALEAVNFLADSTTTSQYETPTLRRESSVYMPQSALRLTLTKRF